MPWYAWIPIVGIITATILWRLQSQRGKLDIMQKLDEEPYTLPTSGANLKTNPDGVLTRTIEFEISSKSRHPLQLDSGFIAVMKYWPSIKAPISRWWPFKDYYAIDYPNQLPAELQPRGESIQLHTYGYDIAEKLRAQGTEGEVLIFLGFYDSRNNRYYGKPMRVLTEEWIEGTGKIHWLFF